MPSSERIADKSYESGWTSRLLRISSLSIKAKVDDSAEFLANKSKEEGVGLEDI